MTRQPERHARNKSDWSSPPGRKALIEGAVADQDVTPVKTPRAPAPKDTRRWCKGKPGREHTPVITQATTGWRPRECRWTVGWRRADDGWSGRVAWECIHQETCSACRKILRSVGNLRLDECPAYPGDPEQRAGKELQARMESQRRAWMPRRPAITGPQGYRRKRDSGNAG